MQIASSSPSIQPHDLSTLVRFSTVSICFPLGLVLTASLLCSTLLYSTAGYPTFVLALCSHLVRFFSHDIVALPTLTRSSLGLLSGEARVTLPCALRSPTVLASGCYAAKSTGLGCRELLHRCYEAKRTNQTDAPLSSQNNSFSHVCFTSSITVSTNLFPQMQNNLLNLLTLSSDIDCRVRLTNLLDYLPVQYPFYCTTSTRSSSLDSTLQNTQTKVNMRTGISDGWNGMQKFPSAPLRPSH
ncbi:hypothetical protein BDU57DRAFT_40820 [Ampelomyces quisqualis]|uniref:Uncharacterized protein n=1 Tax=Ampelomyces quisqualis TaxID=50730 RepID=A0A6A5R235_AMPQU|nr:hypothetical protein BDU57DRAFT_40820 [Ampelomyces quisqualis]